MDWFWSNLSSWMTILSFIVGGTVFAQTIRNDVAILGSRIQKLEDGQHKMQDVLIYVARQDERINAMDQRQLAEGRRLDKLEHRLWGDHEEAEG
jgi:hypothetical protein